MNIGDHTAALGNSAPPGRSMLPSATFSTNTSQVASVPNSCVHVPIRLYRTGRCGRGEIRREATDRRRGNPGGRLDVAPGRTARPARRRRRGRRPGRPGAQGDGSAPCSASVRSMANNSSASVPGRTGTHSEARRAVAVRRGSMTTTRPPRPPDRGQASHDVGRREHRSLRRRGVGAHHHQVVGAVEVGDRRIPHPAEQQCAHHVQRPLVDGAGRVVRGHARRAGQSDQRPDVGFQAQVVRHRIAEVDGYRGGSEAVDHRAQHLLGLGERVIPRDRHVVTGPGAHQRRAQPIRVVVDVVQRGAFGAQMAARPHVVGVTAHRGGGAVRRR